MDRVDSIMERLGFREDGDDSVKAAFVKNLIKQAYGVDVKIPPQYELKKAPQNIEELHDASPEAPSIEVGQLSFDFEKTNQVG